MEHNEHLETEIKELVFEALLLEDFSGEDIQSTQLLFGEGLGLDSIDALEISMVLEERYGAVLDAESESNRNHFESVRTLAAFVEKTRD